MSALLTHLTSMAKLGAIGFGGGSALIPLFEKELVSGRKVLSEDEFTRHTVVANVTPGGLPTKLAGLSGLRLAGVPGAVLGGFAAALPGTLIALLLIALFGVLGQSGVRAIEYASVGISAYVVVVLLQYVIKVLRQAPNPVVAVVIALAVAVATGLNEAIAFVGQLLGQTWETELPQLSSVAVVVVALVLVVVATLAHRVVPADDSGGLHARPGVSSTSTHDDSLARPALVSAGVLTALLAVSFLVSWAVAGAEGLWFMGLIALSVAATFGGGNAYIAVGAGFFVSSGLVSAAGFYGQLVPVGNATPGPLIIKLAAELGWGYGAETHSVLIAAVLATCAFVQAVAVSNITGLAVLAGYERYQSSRILANISTHILPVIAGMLIATAFDMARTSTILGSQGQVPTPMMAWAFLALAAGCWLVMARAKLHDLLVILLAGGLTLGVLLAIG